MVMPVMSADLCPQCGADVRAAGTRCRSCGFYLPARPAPRTGPPTARPAPLRDDSRKLTIVVLTVGGVVVLGLLGVGTVIATRSPSSAPSAPPVTAAISPTPAVAPARAEPSALLSDARRRAVAWRADAVLTRLSVENLDAGGVAEDGVVSFSYSTPAAKQITGGAETSADGLTVTWRRHALSSSEERVVKARVVPEPNCLFEDAWAAAQRAGSNPNARLRLSYAWSDKHARPVWEVATVSGEILKRLDGVSCSILTR